LNKRKSSASGELDSLVQGSLNGKESQESEARIK